jgi:hypothetical protein
LAFGDSEVNKLKIAVGVPTLSNFKGLAELFASLWGEEYTPFVVSNWVTNIGVSKSWNEVLHATHTTYDLLVVCNDDILFHGNSFSRLREEWARRPADCIMMTGSTEVGWKDKFVRGAPDYSCFAVNPSEFLAHFGHFDENFTPAYFEDNDSHYRIKLSGKEAYRLNEAQITHKGSQTQNANPKAPIVTSQMFENNRSYYVEKWGGTPGCEKYDRPYNDPNNHINYWRGVNDR